MQPQINIADDHRSAQVNGKNVYQDDNGNWLATTAPLTDLEKRSLFYRLKDLGFYTKAHQPPLFFGKVKRRFFL